MMVTAQEIIDAVMVEDAIKQREGELYLLRLTQEKQNEQKTRPKAKRPKRK